MLEYPIEAHLRAIQPQRSAQPTETELEGHATDRLSASVREADLPAGTQIHVALGAPAVEILAAAQRDSTDLIVMGTPGAGRLGRALVGSVADAVLRRAPCPVLALPTP